jgi:hypothetical protein
MVRLSLLKTGYCLAFLVSGLGTTHAQDKNESFAKKAIQSNYYTFTPVSYASPSIGGAARQISLTYEVRVTADSVVVSLPYFGVSSSPQIGPATGIEFGSTRFDYRVNENRKGKWLVSIKPKDAKEVKELFLTIFSDGTAILQVTSTNREPTTFNGYISQLPIPVALKKILS